MYYLVKINKLSLLIIFLLISVFLGSSNNHAYELNKNIVYFQDIFKGILLEDRDKWSIVCEENNENNCILTQFLETKTDAIHIVILVNIIRDEDTNYIRIILKEILNEGPIPEDIYIISKDKQLAYNIKQSQCIDGQCEFIDQINPEFMSMLREDNDFIIGVSFQDLSLNIGALVSGEEFSVLYGKIKQ
jgi:invasion protein IalB